MALGDGDPTRHAVFRLVADDPEAALGAVCALHLGIAQGMTEGTDGLEVDELVARDPRREACVLRLHVEGR